jgi:hypothetical protein
MVTECVAALERRWTTLLAPLLLSDQFCLRAGRDRIRTAG